MNTERYNELLTSLDKYIIVSGSKPVSPTLPRVGISKAAIPTHLFIVPDMDLKSKSKETLFYIHAMLHRFYSSGKNKNLNKKDIENLHTQVIKLIPHANFDKLDKNDK